MLTQIRSQLAAMAQRIEATHAWIETGKLSRGLALAHTRSDLLPCSTVVYQSTQYDPDTISLRLGGTMALLKAQSTGACPSHPTPPPSLSLTR